MEARTTEFQKIISAKKMANKMKENIVKSTMKLYRQKSSPYKLVRNKPVKDVEMSNSTFSQPLVVRFGPISPKPISPNPVSPKTHLAETYLAETHLAETHLAEA
ncbi:unnamed protein product [Macrosiphum euphorbiae]|uniref:Uncharacterized protein n=1 Tax=Macrosiphum euphorbiae TaxID=13131 RepID=A0AAV0XV65_9HEMI|nr:unnamed protein product [Macrosiphum euphorbiae]